MDEPPFAVTVEHTYNNGPRGTLVTKVGPGEYQCVRSHYHKGNYDCWQIVGNGITPERRILIHKGNLEDDSDGCLLIGEQFGMLHGKPGILQSGAGFAELMSTTQGVDEFPLIVTNV
jgi:hypothetical protein